MKPTAKALRRASGLQNGSKQKAGNATSIKDALEALIVLGFYRASKR